MHHDTPTTGSGRTLWRVVATVAMLLALIGGSFTQVAAATTIVAVTPAPTATPHGQTGGNHGAKPDTKHAVAPHGATATGIAAQGGATVAGWGDNNDLYFCDGDYTGNDVLAPRTNPSFSGVTAIAAGGDHALYLLSDGTVYSCGNNEYGILGIGNADNYDYGAPQQVLGVCPSPSPVPAAGGIVAPATPAHTATECGHLTNIKAIAAGGYSLSLALDTSGTVYAWGDNRSGQLGVGNAINSGPEVCSYSSQYNGDTTETHYGSYRSCSTTPVRVPGLTNVVQIVVGDTFAAVLRADGSVFAWGANYDAQLGQADTGPQRCTITDTDANGTTSPGYFDQPCSASPVPVAGLPTIAQIMTGSDADHVLALDTTGHVWAWGYNRNGELGRGFASPDEPTPAQVLGLGGAAGSMLATVAQPDPAKPYIERLAANDNSSYAVLTDGTVAAWGYNGNGDLGIGDTTAQPVPPVGGCSVWMNACYTYPVLVHGVDNVGVLGNIAGLGSGGDDNGFAITTDGRLYSWGYNGYGNLGIGVEPPSNNRKSGNKTTPVAVLSTNGTGQLSNVLAVSASDDDWAIALIGAKATPSATSLAFGGQTVGTTSASKSVTLTNDGGGPLTISGTTLTGANASDFTQNGGCAGTIPAKGTCTVNVTFTPAAVGARAAMLSLATSAGQVDVALSGTGVAVPVTVTSYTVVASASGGGTVTPAGTATYTGGTVASYSAAAAAGQTFTGWTLDGTYVGYASPLTLTVTANRTLVATFVATPTFSDIGSLPAADQQMITFLAALGIINPNGVNGSGQFQPNNDVVRAEVAAFIARTFGWENEFHANTFPDRCEPGNPTNCIDAKLWNDVAALKDYGVVGGYTDASTCTGAGTTAPCYLPRDGVKRVQVVSIVARAFIKAPDLRPTGFWDRLAADPAQYTDIGTEGTQRSDLTTYRQNAGPIPCQQSDATFGTCSTATGPKTAQDSASRLFVIHVLYQAFNAQFGVDRVP